MKELTKIKRRHIQAKYYGYGKKNTPKYIVIHYTANPGTSAAANANYFTNPGQWVTEVKDGYTNTYWKPNKVSAHFIVDEKEIIQCVQPHYPAWHCGGSVWKGTNPTHNCNCFNINSIGIEMCIDNDGKFKYETEEKTIDLVAALMKDYDIPINNVIRHYDVKGKPCPEPYLDKWEWEWEYFKRDLTRMNIFKSDDRKATQVRFGFDDNTMAFLDNHPYVDALYMKLATKK